jgi:hypothetical protein
VADGTTDAGAGEGRGTPATRRCSDCGGRVEPGTQWTPGMLLWLCEDCGPSWDLAFAAAEQAQDGGV